MSLAQEMFDRTVAEQSGKQQALALLAAASDPDGTKERIEELTRATEESEAAQRTAAKAQADAEARIAAAEKAEAELAARIEQFQIWCDRTTRDVKNEQGNVAGRAAELTQREAEIQRRADRLDAHRQKLRHLAEQLRGWLGAVDELMK
jgi:chromosome segregation ATPase